MSLRQTVQGQKAAHLWSLRWLIVAAFVQGSAVLYLGLSMELRAAIPAWAFVVWGALALLVALLAAVARVVAPADGRLNLLLGSAVAPRLRSRGAAATAAAEVASAEDADPPP